ALGDDEPDLLCRVREQVVDELARPEARIAGDERDASLWHFALSRATARGRARRRSERDVVVVGVREIRALGRPRLRAIALGYVIPLRGLAKAATATATAAAAPAPLQEEVARH